MREHATTTHAKHTRVQVDAKRFRPLCRLGFTIRGSNAKGFTATDPVSGKEIRRLTFDAFTKAVRAAGMTRAARSELLEKRSKPEYKARERVNIQRLQLLARERREVCPDKRQPRPIRTAAPVRRLRINNCGNVGT